MKLFITVYLVLFICSMGFSQSAKKDTVKKDTARVYKSIEKFTNQSNFGKFVESASVQLIPYLNDIFKVF